MPYYWTMDARGNSFVVVRDPGQLDGPQLARRWCSGHAGLLTDGLLGLRATPETIGLSMWNRDGTVDFCANGVACAFFLAHTRGWSWATRVNTRIGPIPVEFIGDPAEATVALTLPPPSFAPTAVPVRLPRAVNVHEGLAVDVPGGPLSVVPLSTGTTHCVAFVETLPPDAVFVSTSSALEHHRLFPDGTSVVWCVAAWDRVVLRIWERGVGETLSCGTGAAAAAAVGAMSGRCGPLVEAESAGGVCAVHVRPDGIRITTAVRMRGEGVLPDRAARVFSR